MGIFAFNGFCVTKQAIDVTDHSPSRSEVPFNPVLVKAMLFDAANMILHSLTIVAKESKFVAINLKTKHDLARLGRRDLGLFSVKNVTETPQQALDFGDQSSD